MPDTVLGIDYDCFMTSKNVHYQIYRKLYEVGPVIETHCIFFLSSVKLDHLTRSVVFKLYYALESPGGLVKQRFLPWEISSGDRNLHF